MPYLDFSFFQDPSITTFLICRLLAFTLFLWSIEIAVGVYKKGLLKVWSFENLKTDLRFGLPIPYSWTDFLFSDQSFKALIFIQILLCILGFLFPNLIIFSFIFLFQFIICIRFRGTFNGGSDMMAFVILTGVLISLYSEKLQKVGLIYIAIHTLYSYLKAGLAKVIRSDWRKGLALPAFIKRSLFSDMQLLADWLEQKKFLNIGLCWGVLFFELSIVALLFFPQIAWVYFIMAFCFHFLIYMTFGLNRFFWIWLCAWPAVFHSLHLLTHLTNV